MLVRSIMRNPIRPVPSTMSVGQAAALMRQCDVAELAVVDHGQLVGLITGRDIATRYVGNGVALHPLPVAQFMSRNLITCRDSDDIETAAAFMGDHQVRRLPVFDAVGRLVGMLTLDAIAEDYSEQLAGEILGEIVETR